MGKRSAQMPTTPSAVPNTAKPAGAFSKPGSLTKCCPSSPTLAIMATRPCFNSAARSLRKPASSPTLAKPRGSKKTQGRHGADLLARLEGGRRRSVTRRQRGAATPAGCAEPAPRGADRHGASGQGGGGRRGRRGARLRGEHLRRHRAARRHWGGRGSEEGGAQHRDGVQCGARGRLRECDL